MPTSPRTRRCSSSCCWSPNWRALGNQWLHTAGAVFVARASCTPSGLAGNPGPVHGPIPGFARSAGRRSSRLSRVPARAVDRSMTCSGKRPTFYGTAELFSCGRRGHAQPSAFSSSGRIVNRSPTRPMSATLEDRRFGVLVDRDDRARVLDAGQVLDRARDADREVQLRRNDLAGLADLQIVRGVARVDRGARCADGGAELVGEAVDDLEVVGAAERAAARHDARADCRSGRPVAAPERETKRVCEGSGDARVRRSRSAHCRRVRAASNEAVRTVATTGSSGGASTVRIALPA